jgi:DNA-binding response OmpR family regulator
MSRKKYVYEGAVMPPDSPSRFQRILVIDDDAAILMAVATVLEQSGFQVFTAQSGREATAMILEHPIDLLITDLNMPDEDGIEIIRRLRKDHRQLKVIAMSGAFGPNIMTVAQKLGAHATLSKPMTGTKLLDCIRKLSDAEPDDLS